MAGIGALIWVRRLVQQCRSAGPAGIGRDDALRHFNEQRSFPFCQVFQRGAMGGACGRLDPFQENFPRSGQFAKPCAAIVLIYGPFDEMAAGQPFERAGRRRAIERNICCQSRLIGRLARRECGKQAVLQRGDVKSSACLMK